MGEFEEKVGKEGPLDYLLKQKIKGEGSEREPHIRCDFGGCLSGASAYGLCRDHQKTAINLYHEKYETDPIFKRAKYIFCASAEALGRAGML